jgi:hypothetical protein
MKKKKMNEAHMGKSGEGIYYDKDLGRWIIPGEELSDVEDRPPPPLMSGKKKDDGLRVLK